MTMVGYGMTVVDFTHDKKMKKVGKHPSWGMKIHLYILFGLYKDQFKDLDRKNGLFVRILPDLKQSRSKWLTDFEMTLNVMANTASVKRAQHPKWVIMLVNP